MKRFLTVLCVLGLTAFPFAAQAQTEPLQPQTPVSTTDAGTPADETPAA